MNLDVYNLPFSSPSAKRRHFSATEQLGKVGTTGPLDYEGSSSSNDTKTTDDSNLPADPEEQEEEESQEEGEIGDEEEEEQEKEEEVQATSTKKPKKKKKTLTRKDYPGTYVHAEWTKSELLAYAHACEAPDTDKLCHLLAIGRK